MKTLPKLQISFWNKISWISFYRYCLDSWTTTQWCVFNNYSLLAIDFFVTCFFQKLAIFGFVLKSDQKANHSQMYKKWLCSKSFMSKRYSWKNPSSLSKWSNYSSSIRKMLSKKFCPKNLFAILAKFSSICEIFAMFKKNEVSKKIRILQGVWIISWMLHKHWFLLNIVFFINPAMISL